MARARKVTETKMNATIKVLREQLAERMTKFSLLEGVDALVSVDKIRPSLHF